MTLLRAAVACPLCGAAACACGAVSPATPLDAGLWQPGRYTMADEQVLVEHRPGQRLKLTRKQAAVYVREHPGARIVGDPLPTPPAPSPAVAEPEVEAKALQAAEVEDKAVRARRAKRAGDDEG